MPGDGTGNGRISPVTLYGVFLKNKVNKTWDAEPRILITCLRLWGRRGDAARERGTVRDMKRERASEERRKGKGREEGCFAAFTFHRHQWDVGAWGGSMLLLSVVIVGEAGWQKTSAKHCILKIIWQQCTTLVSLYNSTTAISMYIWNVLEFSKDSTETQLIFSYTFQLLRGGD